jgi:hypothetical protein
MSINKIRIKTVPLTNCDIINIIYGLKILAATQVQNPNQLKEIKDLINQLTKELEE